MVYTLKHCNIIPDRIASLVLTTLELPRRKWQPQTPRRREGTVACTAACSLAAFNADKLFALPLLL